VLPALYKEGIVPLDMQIILKMVRSRQISKFIKRLSQMIILRQLMIRLLSRNNCPSCSSTNLTYKKYRSLLLNF
jgi:hypothetical protein